jgi:hypothetical protein
VGLSAVQKEEEEEEKILDRLSSPVAALSSSPSSGLPLAGIRNLSLAIFRGSDASGSFGRRRRISFRLKSIIRLNT